MKIYSIIATIVAVLAVAVAGYFYNQYNGLYGEVDSLKKDKALVESHLDWADGQLAKISETTAAFKAVTESFMIPGDLKALTIGSKEAALVEQQIAGISDSTDRMSAEKEWNEFKTSLRLNALFALYRNFGNNLERTLEQAQ